MDRRLLTVALIALCPAWAFADLSIRSNLKTGEEVYRGACVACHETGVAHAPRLGDKAQWAPLIGEGQPVLTAHAWVGVRAMPPRGGDPELTLVEFSRAVAWMAGQSGGDWKEPDVATMRKILKEADRRLDKLIREARSMKKELQQLGAGAR
jgi:cytochrome c5